MGGRPRRRSVNCKPSSSAVAATQESSPNGRPRATHLRSACTWVSCWGSLTSWAHRRGFATGHGPRIARCSALPYRRRQRLPHRQSSAPSTINRQRRKGLAFLFLVENQLPMIWHQTIAAGPNSCGNGRLLNLHLRNLATGDQPTAISQPSEWLAPGRIPQSAVASISFYPSPREGYDLSSPKKHPNHGSKVGGIGR